MNLLDLLILLGLVVAAIGGWRMGLLARAASWAGAIGGLALGVWLVPKILGWFGNGSAAIKLITGLLTFVLAVGLLSSVGELVGLRLRRAVHATPARGLDHVGGSAAGIVGVLALVWIMVPAMSEVPGTVSRQARSSSIATWIATTAPRPPDPIKSLRNLISEADFPEVFADLRPAPDTGPPPSQVPVPQDVVARATASTVNVEADGCSRRQEGSGWAVAEDLVVTNAHVVAGTDSIQVRRPDGQVLPATAVAFDDNRDLALLQVGGLGQAPLAIAEPQPGGEGAEIGYPGGQNQPRVAPVGISDVRTAVGRDIYGQDRTERQVVFLSAELRQGDSGAAVIDPNGAVVGVVFAVAADRSTTAYALAPSEVRAILDAPRRPGETGACI